MTCIYRAGSETSSIGQVGSLREEQPQIDIRTESVGEIFVSVDRGFRLVSRRSEYTRYETENILRRKLGRIIPSGQTVCIQQTGSERTSVGTGTMRHARHGSDTLDVVTFESHESPQNIEAAILIQPGKRVSQLDIKLDNPVNREIGQVHRLECNP